MARWTPFRPYSITTRIKTSRHNILHTLFDLLDPIPLQQGLRPHTTSPHHRLCQLLDPIPLQQGLRLVAAGVLLIFLDLLDPIPLQQGLRQ